MTKKNKILLLFFILCLLSLIVMAEWYNLANIHFAVTKSPNFYIDHINNIDDIEHLRAETIKLYNNQNALLNSNNNNVLYASYLLGAAGVFCLGAILKIVFSLFKLPKKIYS